MEHGLAHLHLEHLVVQELVGAKPPDGLLGLRGGLVGVQDVTVVGWVFGVGFEKGFVA